MEFRLATTIIILGLLSSCGGGTSNDSIDDISEPSQALSPNEGVNTNSASASNERLTYEQVSNDALSCFYQGLITEEELLNPNTNIDAFMAEQPVINFGDSTIDGTFDIHHDIYMNAYKSSVACSTIESFKWEQVSPEHPQVNLYAADTVRTNLLITESMHNVPFLFQLTVKATDGRTATKELAALWQVNGARSDIKTGVYTDENMVAFHPADLTSVLIANAGENSIDHVNIESNEVLKSIGLPGVPTIIEYIDSENKLYVGLAGISQIARVDVDTATVEIIPTDGEAIGFAVRNETLHFLINSSANDSDLFALIDGFKPKRFGSVEGNSIEFSIGDELLVLGPGKFSRYALKEDGALFRIQQVDAYHSNFGYSTKWDTIYIAHGDKTHTVLAYDLTFRYSFVEDGDEVGGYSLSNSQNHYISFTKHNALVYDAAHLVLEGNFKITNERCDSENINIIDAQFSVNEKQVFVLAECDGLPQSQFIYYSDSPLAVINTY